MYTSGVCYNVYLLQQVGKIPRSVIVTNHTCRYVRQPECQVGTGVTKPLVFSNY